MGFAEKEPEVKSLLQAVADMAEVEDPTERAMIAERLSAEAIAMLRAIDPQPITILQLAEYRLGRKAVTGEDFAEAGVAIMGGCGTCGASIAAYNAHPSKAGVWKCEDCIGGDGWSDVVQADADIFGDEPQDPEPDVEDGGYLCVNCERPLPSYYREGSLCERCDQEEG